MTTKAIDELNLLSSAGGTTAVGIDMSGVASVADGESGSQLEEPLRSEADDFTDTPSRTANERFLAFAYRVTVQPCGRAVALVVPVNRVVEIIDATSWSAIPDGADHVRGEIVWRKQAIVVLDPSCWVGLGNMPLESSRVVVTKIGGVIVGLLAGPTVTMLAPSVPCIPTRHHVTLNPNRVLGVYDTTDLTIILPDWRGFIASNRTV